MFAGEWMRLVLACLLGLLWGSAVHAEPPAEGIWGYWPLSGDVNDYSPNRRDGVAQGKVADAAMQGPFAGAVAFSGGWIAVPPAPLSASGSFTAAAWVFFDSGARGFAPVVGRMGVHGNRMQLAYNAGNDAGAPAIISEIGLVWRRWSHVAVVWDEPARVMSFWQRGIRVLSVDVAPDVAVPPPLSGPFALGGPASGPQIFTGRLAEVLVYDRALSAEEIQFLSDGAGRQTPQQLAMSVGCGSTDQGPCWVCRRYQAWPPAQWSDCTGGRQPWCAGNPNSSQHATCP